MSEQQELDDGVVAPPNNSAIGWFDDITLEVAPCDVIFQDDFDPSERGEESVPVAP